MYPQPFLLTDADVSVRFRHWLNLADQVCLAVFLVFTRVTCITVSIYVCTQTISKWCNGILDNPDFSSYTGSLSHDLGIRWFNIIVVCMKKAHWCERGNGGWEILSQGWVRAGMEQKYQVPGNHREKQWSLLNLRKKSYTENATTLGLTLDDLKINIQGHSYIDRVHLKSTVTRTCRAYMKAIIRDNIWH